MAEPRRSAAPDPGDLKGVRILLVEVALLRRHRRHAAGRRSSGARSGGRDL